MWILSGQSLESSYESYEYDVTYQFTHAPGASTFTGVLLQGPMAEEEIKGSIKDGEITWTGDKLGKKRRTGQLNATYDCITSGRTFYMGKLLDTFVGRFDENFVSDTVSLAIETKAPPTQINVTGSWIIDVKNSNSTFKHYATYQLTHATDESTFTGVLLKAAMPEAEAEEKIKGSIKDGEITWTGDKLGKKRRTGQLNATCDRITSGKMFYMGHLIDSFVGRLEKRSSELSPTIETKTPPPQINVTGSWIIDVQSSNSTLSLTYQFVQVSGTSTFTGSVLMGSRKANELTGLLQDGEIQWKDKGNENTSYTGRINGACDRITDGQLLHRGRPCGAFVGRREGMPSTPQTTVKHATGAILQAHGAWLMMPPGAVPDGTVKLRRAAAKEKEDLCVARSKSDTAFRELQRESSVFEVEMESQQKTKHGPLKPSRFMLPISSANSHGIEVVHGNSMKEMRRIPKEKVEVKKRHVIVTDVAKGFRRFVTVIKNTFAKIGQPQRIGVAVFAPKLVDPNTTFPLIVAFYRDRPECKAEVAQLMASRKPHPCYCCCQSKSMNAKKGSTLTWKAGGGLMEVCV